MRDQYLFDNWQQALNHKQNVINNTGIHFYPVTVKVKHANKLVLGMRGNPHYTYHEELRFNFATYNHAISQADQQINQCVQAVDNKINEYRAELNTENITHRNAEKLKQDINLLRSQTGSYHDSNNQLRGKIDQSIYEMSNINSQASQIAKQVKAANVEYSHVQDKANNLNCQLTNLRNELYELDEETFNVISSTDDAHRTEMLAELIINYSGSSQKVLENINQTINIIEHIGFDPNHLAYIAIEKNHMGLLEFSMEHDAQFTDYAISGKTLLQRAVIDGRSEMVSKILETNQNLEVTLLNAVNNSDIKTIEELLSHDLSYLNKPIYGYSLLHVAVSGKNYAVAKALLNLDVEHSSVNNLTCLGESPFKIAIRSSNKAVIDLLLPLIDVEQELSAMIKSNSKILFERALTYCNVDSHMKQLLLLKSLNNNDLEIATLLCDRGADLTQIFDDARDNHDQQILQKISDIAPEYLDMVGEIDSVEKLQETNIDLLGTHTINTNFYE